MTSAAGGSELPHYPKLLKHPFERTIKEIFGGEMKNFPGVIDGFKISMPPLTIGFRVRLLREAWNMRQRFRGRLNIFRDRRINMRLFFKKGWLTGKERLVFDVGGLRGKAQVSVKFERGKWYSVQAQSHSDSERYGISLELAKLEDA